MIQRTIAALFALMVCALQHASATPLTPVELTSYPFCERLDQDTRATVQQRVAEARSSCQLHTDDLTPESAQAALGDRALALVRDGDHITLYARLHADNAFLCCSLQTQMTISTMPHSHSFPRLPPA